MENDITDALLEVRNVAADVAAEEQGIVGLEHEIAEQMRVICNDLFGGTMKYRMPVQRILEDEGDEEPLRVWLGVGPCIANNVELHNGDFSGDALVLRVTTDGRLLAVWMRVYPTHGYDLDSEEASYGPWEMPPDRTWRIATDREIAANAESLATDLLAALRKRIDTAKESKEKLTRVRDAMAGSD